jgi:hypothetical protein
MSVQLFQSPIRALDSIEITNFLRNKAKIFQGVFASNNIPASLALQEKFAIICNLSPDSSPGSHWVTIYGQANAVYYLCSYGVIGYSTKNKSISSFLKKCRRPINFNWKRLQNDNSNYCGYYCILFVLLADRNRLTDIDLLSTYFTNNLANNDKNCITYIKQILNNQ